MTVPFRLYITVLLKIYWAASHRKQGGYKELRFSLSKSVGFFITSIDEVTRDYTYGETVPVVRRCRLLPWIPSNLEEVSSVTTEPPDSYYEVRAIKHSRIYFTRSFVIIFVYMEPSLKV